MKIPKMFTNDPEAVRRREEAQVSLKGLRLNGLEVKNGQIKGTVPPEDPGKLTLRGAFKIPNKEWRPVQGTTARVEHEGQVRDRFTATRFVFLGPYALAFKKATNKDVFIEIEGPDFVMLEVVESTKAPKAREFARLYNDYVARHFGTPDATDAPANHRPEVTSTAAGPAAERQPDVADQLLRLANLRDQGILTEEEFAAQKAKLLAEG